MRIKDLLFTMSEDLIVAMEKHTQMVKQFNEN